MIYNRNLDTGIRFKVYIAFEDCSYLNAKGGSLWLCKIYHLFDKLFFTNCIFYKQSF